jgi:hypothetical protein
MREWCMVHGTGRRNFPREVEREMGFFVVEAKKYLFVIDYIMAF